MIRDMSCLLSFIVPLNIDTKELNFKIVATHADSPCIRITSKPHIKHGKYN